MVCRYHNAIFALQNKRELFLLKASVTNDNDNWIKYVKAEQACLFKIKEYRIKAKNIYNEVKYE